MIALGIAVGADLAARWREWLAPRVQPFFVTSLRAWPAPSAAGNDASLTAELRNTYKVWRLGRDLKTLWLDDETFAGMPRTRRAALVRDQRTHGRGAVPPVRRWADLIDPGMLQPQADGHRFVWWPSLVEIDADRILRRVIERAPDGVEKDGLPSRHGDVSDTTWERCADALPCVRQLAGSFPEASAPNCFSTVMAAAGVEGAADAYMLQEPFLDWLATKCRPGGNDDDPGTVLVWRGSDGLPVHAAVTIGDGWVFEKASGEWWTPRAVRRVDDVVRATRARGQRLERHRISAPVAHRSRSKTS